MKTRLRWTIPLLTAFLAINSFGAESAYVAGDLGVDGLYFRKDPNGTLLTKPADFQFPWNYSDPNIYFGISSGNVGIGTATPSARLDISGSSAVPLQMNSTWTGGTWMNLINSAAGGRSWNLISTGPTNSEGAGKLLIRDNNANAVRMAFDTTGKVGIGTVTPAAPLDINLGSGIGFKVYSDLGQTGITSYDSGIIRLRDSLEVWPSSNWSRPAKLTIRNSIDGSPAILLDGSNGKIFSYNMPAVKSVQTFSSRRGNGGAARVSMAAAQSQRDVDTISVSIPSDGYLQITATLDCDVYASETYKDAPLYFKLDETTDAQANVQLVEQTLKVHGEIGIPGVYMIQTTGTITLNWTLPTSAGTRSFKTSAYAPEGNAGYHSHTLSVMYLPNSL